ncbi:MAG: hypothetical protein IKS13_10545 [Ruminococcus sp.]|nr:hypothetical protein [Ruminococcus sp.]MBR6986152.1 hypothetical protein [Ruminococcus sp.]
MEALKNLFKSKKILTVAVIIILIPIIAVACSHHKKKTLLNKISDSYFKNAAVCLEKYDGKKVTFICEVSSIDASLDHIMVSEVNDDELLNIEAYIVSCNLGSEKLKKKAKKLKKGDVIEVTGTLHLSDIMIFSIDVDTEKIS